MDGMEGMMSKAQMDELDAAPDADFEQLWLSMMREYHAGAITMAHAEVEDGHKREAIALAEEIITSQSAEIDPMEDLG
jgi:uncharacterized protein (DUF305 family)